MLFERTLIHSLYTSYAIYSRLVVTVSREGLLMVFGGVVGIHFAFKGAPRS